MVMAVGGGILAGSIDQHQFWHFIMVLGFVPKTRSHISGDENDKVCNDFMINANCTLLDELLKNIVMSLTDN